MKILVIDDSLVDFRLVERALGNEFTPTHAETLAAGLKAAAVGVFDLLILDLFLPDSKGYETFERAHIALPDLPILVLSGLDDDAVALRAMSQGAQDFVRKSQLLDYPLNRAAHYAVERFGAARAVRESEYRYRALFHNLPTAAYTCDANGLITDFNAKAVEAWGRAPKLNDPDDRFTGAYKLLAADGTPLPKDQGWMARALRERRGFNGCEVIFERPNGDRCEGLAHANPFLDSHANVRGAINVFVDISRQRNAERELRESERFSRAVVDALSAHVAILDNTGRIIATNLAWQRFGVENGLLGRESTVGCNYLVTCDGAAGRDSEFARDAAAGMRSVLSGATPEFYMEYPCHAPNTQRWFALRVTRFGEGDGTRLVVAHENITERKRYAAAEQERLALHSAVAAMDQVLGVVGHELRTPLAGLQAISEFLLDSRSHGTPEFQKFLVSLHLETKRMSDTVDNLLEAARLNSGRARWNWGTVRLQDVCAEAVEGIRPQIDDKAVWLEFNVTPPSAEMRGDAGAIRRLVINLLANAKKHTVVGRIELSARIEADADGVLWTEFSIRDTGDGIAPAILERLGQAFSLNSGVIGDSHVRGSGLGLAICRGIAAAHGGFIRVESEMDKGTIVTARVRADLPDAVEAEPAEVKIVSGGCCT
jgi:signal transduction histidine kinase/FixJ family two-component response regulator